MTVRYEHYLETAYRRRVYLAVQLLDAVTMTRVSSGMTVVAEGLKNKPVVNRSGCFVWLEEENAVTPKIIVDPGYLPYEKTEVPPANVAFPLTTIEVHPRPDYQFGSGVTGLRGTVIEASNGPIVPVGDGEVWLEWRNVFLEWRDSGTVSKTRGTSGDFVSIVRLTPDDNPNIDLGELTVRLWVKRGPSSRHSEEFQLVQGRITDPVEDNKRIFAWDELTP